MTAPRTAIKEGQFVGITYTHIDSVCARGDKPILNAGRSHSPYQTDNCLFKLTIENEYLEENDLRKEESMTSEVKKKNKDESCIVIYNKTR